MPVLGSIAGCENADPVSALAGSAFEKIAGEFGKAANQTTQTMASSWLHLDGAHLSNTEGPVLFLNNHLQWFVSWIAVLSLVVAAGQMAWKRRAEPAREALRGLINLVLVTGAGVGTFNLLIEAGDAFSTWIVTRAMNCQPDPNAFEYSSQCGKKFGELVGGVTAASAAAPTIGPALLLVASLLVVFAAIVQIFLLIVQKATLPVLASTLTLAAAGSGTAWGHAWLKKSLGMTLALTLYKPAAAIVYAAAFYGMNAGDSNGDKGSLSSVISGVVLMLMAVFTLPALMRVAIPAVEGATGGSGSASGIGSVGAAVASGAISIKTAGASTATKMAAKGATQAAVSGAKSVAGKDKQIPGQGGSGSAPSGASAPKKAPTPPKADTTNAPSDTRSAPAGGQVPRGVPNGRPPMNNNQEGPRGSQ
ncbi:hypothetical protein [Streptomyces kronopolitis]